MKVIHTQPSSRSFSINLHSENQVSGRLGMSGVDPLDLQMVVVHNVALPSSSDGCGSQCYTAIIFRWLWCTMSHCHHLQMVCGAQCYTAIIFRWLWCTMLHSHHIQLAVVHNVTQPSSSDGCGAQCYPAIIFRWLWCTMSHGHHLQIAVVHNVTQPLSSIGCGAQCYTAIIFRSQEGRHLSPCLPEHVARAIFSPPFNFN